MASIDPRSQAHLLHARRKFLQVGAGGLGALAFSALSDGHALPAAEGRGRTAPLERLAPRVPHFPPKVERCIYIYLEGGPSQMDLFDPKPRLNEMDGQKLPDSFLEGVQFAFINKAET